MLACSESFLSAADWSFWQPVVIELGIISNVNERRTFVMIRFDEVGVTKEEGRLLWPWVHEIKCLNNYEASLDLADYLVHPLGRQESVFRACGSFAKVPPVRWYRGLDFARLLSLPGRKDALEASWSRHVLAFWMKSSLFWKSALNQN